LSLNEVVHAKRGFEARWNEAKAIILTRPRPRPGFLASRPRP